MWLLLALLVTFVVVRSLTRRIRSGGGGGRVRDIVIGGVHIHHMVPGIALMVAAAFLEFRFQPDSPWLEVLAAVFGVGAALVLDEFALSLYVRDVYWAREGRASIDAVVVTLGIGSLLVIGIAPVELESYRDGSWLTLAVAIGLHAVLIAVTIAKGKYVMAAIGVVVPFVALVASVRLARPGSPWARWRYGSRPERRARAEARFGPDHERRLDRAHDLIGGRPSQAVADKEMET